MAFLLNLREARGEVPVILRVLADLGEVGFQFLLKLQPNLGIDGKLSLQLGPLQIEVSTLGLELVTLDLKALVLIL